LTKKKKKNSLVTKCEKPTQVEQVEKRRTVEILETLQGVNTQ